MGEKKEFKKQYDKKLQELQIELVKLQDWVIDKGKKVAIIFEGRDAAGKGGTIKRITENLNPRFCKIVALAAPTEREKSQWYFQRYTTHLPAAGEIVIFDRSWYNRAGVERVMGFCSVSAKEQMSRFNARANDPTKGWKLSPMDLESVNRWDEYSKAKDNMFEHTDTQFSPWYVVESDNKKKARINCINHILNQIKYDSIEMPEVVMPDRVQQKDYERPPRSIYNYVKEVL